MNGGLSRDEQRDLFNSLAKDLNAEQLGRLFSAFGDDHKAGLMNAINSHASASTRIEFVNEVQQKALQNIDVPEGLTDEQKALYLDLAQLALDVVGIAEPTPFADGSNAVISLFRGDWLGAGLSALSIIPYVGDLAKLGKLGKWGTTVSNVVEMAAKNADFAKYAEPLLKKIDDAIGAIPDNVMRNLPESAQDTLNSIRKKIDDVRSGGNGSSVDGTMRNRDVVPNNPQLSFATTDAVQVSGTRAIDLGQSYEVGVRGLYGDVPFNQRQYEAFVDGKWVSGVADNVVTIGGRNTAIEAKFVDDWAASLRNPASQNGTRPWAVAEQQKMLDQATKYSAAFDDVVYHTNSTELAEYYTRIFNDAGIDNFQFVITPATK